MIKFESEKERAETVALWQEAFGDSEEYINFFLDSHCCVCLTEKENNETASMLFLIEGELAQVKGYYLFAAATLKKFRSMGCMPRLLKKAENFAKEQGREFIALVPAEEWLFDYYGKFGYETALFIEEKLPDEKIEIDKKTSFLWCKEHLEYIQKESEKFGSRLINKGEMLFTVYPNGKIKAPSINSKTAKKYGMILNLNRKNIFPKNAYIGLTLDG